MRTALTGADGAAAGQAAHALGGAAANLGATELARLCAVFAANGDAGDLSDSETMLDAIAAELERVRSALRPRRPPLTPVPGLRTPPP